MYSSIYYSTLFILLPNYQQTATQCHNEKDQTIKKQHHSKFIQGWTEVNMALQIAPETLIIYSVGLRL